jgi:hypothetical protein
MTIHLDICERLSAWRAKGRNALYDPSKGFALCRIAAVVGLSGARPAEFRLAGRWPAHPGFAMVMRFAAKLNTIGWPALAITSGGLSSS